MTLDEYEQLVHDIRSKCADCLSGAGSVIERIPTARIPRDNAPLERVRDIETASLAFTTEVIRPLVGIGPVPTQLWLENIEKPEFREYVGRVLRGLSTPRLSVPQNAADLRYALVGCNIRTPRVAEARRTVYLPSLQLLGDSCPGCQACIGLTVPFFYAGLIHVYFEVLERDVTFNERVLDNTALNRKESVGIRFESDNANWLSLQENQGALTFCVGRSVWETLTTDEEGTENLGRLFWKTCWDTMWQAVHAKSQIHDKNHQVTEPEHLLRWNRWFASAIQSLALADVSNKLRRARLRTSIDLVDHTPTEAFKTAKVLFGSEYKAEGPGAALERLLRLLQGVVMLVPWAVNGGVPLPVVTYPVQGGGGDKIPASGVTFVFANLSKDKNFTAEHEKHVALIKGFLQEVVAALDKLYQIEAST